MNIEGHLWIYNAYVGDPEEQRAMVGYCALCAEMVLAVKALCRYAGYRSAV